MRLPDVPRRGCSLAAEVVLGSWPRYVRPLLRVLIVRPPMREIMCPTTGMTQVA
jgi:hypothetical protein